MTHSAQFDVLNKYEKKYSFSYEDYFIPAVKSTGKQEENVQQKGKASSSNYFSVRNLVPFQATKDKIPTFVCTWSLFGENELEEFLKLGSGREIRLALDSKFKTDGFKGTPKIILIELLYSVTKFCKDHEMNLEQTGAMISIFYYTHVYFVRDFYVSAEEVYLYFRKFVLRHCLLAPPDNVKIFTFDESRKIMLKFCSTYLRNLPLIRLLCLPNYAFWLQYHVEEELPILKKKEKKEKKGKAKDKKKKKK